MTDIPNDGGPAYPVLHSIDGNWVREPLDKYSGMSLRDYFAAAALQGMLADTQFNEPPFESSRIAYKYADAMLAERNKIND
jgi:hypothetical protein